jgi:hypothetical protein
MRRELLVLWIAATAPLLFTQSITGRSFGTGYHASKSGVAGTKIFVTNTAQGWTRETVTDKTGNYTIAQLPPGPYKVGVRAAGFQSVSISNINLLVDQPTRVDTTLQPGTITEQITVTARAPLIVEGDSKATRHVVNTRKIRTLPLNGRRFFDLAEADLTQKAYAALRSRRATPFTRRSASGANHGAVTQPRVRLHQKLASRIEAGACLRAAIPALFFKRRRRNFVSTWSGPCKFRSRPSAAPRSTIGRRRGK